MTRKQLALLVPSRGRPGQALRLADAVADLSESGSTEILFGLDHDDIMLPGYLQRMAGRPGVYTVIGERETMVARTNSLWAPNRDVYAYYASLGDDHLPRTPGWDLRLIEAIREMGGTGFAYPNDLLMGENLPTAIVMSADIPDALGWVACPLMRHFCVVPGTPVLTADLRWIPAGKIAAGDELVGVDEWPVRARATRAFRRAVVEELIWRTAECLIITVDDGREVTCSADHRWLAKRRWMGTGQKGRGSFEWRASDQLQPGDRIFSPLRVWDDETSFEAGWLSGMFDGEGCANRCLTGPGRKYFNTHLSVAQNPGPVLDRLEAVLASMGIGYRKEPRHAARDQCMRLTITPRSDAIELLGRLQPTRLRAEVLWEDASAQQRHARFAVVTEIRPAGQAEVVSMSTSTGTFLANGMVAHNCIDNAWKTLGQQAGCLRYLPDVVVEHRHWSSGAADFDETYQHAGVFTPEGEDSEAYAEWWNTRAAADIEAIRGLRSRMV